jgi:hypothetical protein
MGCSESGGGAGVVGVEAAVAAAPRSWERMRCDDEVLVFWLMRCVSFGPKILCDGCWPNSQTITEFFDALAGPSRGLYF